MDTVVSTAKYSTNAVNVPAKIKVLVIMEHYSTTVFVERVSVVVNVNTVIHAFNKSVIKMVSA